uniref:Uncharacterized protein n=1 Tax=viral metagenome TaxID=1070528 RepID=A0A6M3JZ22_9ZZZZ
MEATIGTGTQKEVVGESTKSSSTLKYKGSRDLFGEDSGRKCQREGCGISIEGYHGNALYCKDCQSIVDRERRIKHFQQIRLDRKLTIQQAAFEFLYTNKPFQDCMQGWIDFAIEHGATKINIAWVAWSVRQFGHLKFKNAYVPYFKKWICKNWPEYAKYFKGNK